MGEIKMLKDFKRIFKDTLINNGTTVEPKGRYMVGLKGYEKIIPLKSFSENDLVNYTLNDMAKNKNVSLGTWINDKKVYLDSSVGFNSLKEAISFAKENKQLAIFDIEELNEIKILGGN